MNKDALVTFHDVSAGYDGHVVASHVSFEVDRSTLLTLEGPNGSGKTTIVRVLLGLLSPMHGHVIRHPGLSVGYVPQVTSADLEFPITLTDVVLMGSPKPLSLFHMKADRERAAELLSFAGLSSVARNTIGQVSGGQRQRAFLCRALMSKPDILVLDEPVTYLDRDSESNLYSLLAELRGKVGIVIVTHDHEALANVATQTLNFAPVKSEVANPLGRSFKLR